MRPSKLNDILDILNQPDSDLDLSENEDSYINIAIAGPNEEKAKESDADTDESDDETAANTSHLPRRLLESHVQITTRQKVINVKKNVDASKKNNSSESSSTEGEDTKTVPPRKRSKLQIKKIKETSEAKEKMGNRRAYA